MIQNEEGELTFIYHSEKSDDKSARVYAESLPGYVIKTLDLNKDNITETQLVEIADKMNVDLSDMLDMSYSDESEEGRRRLQSLDKESLLKILVRNHKLIRTPVLIIGKKAFLFDSSSELIKRNMNMKKVTSLKSANPEE